MKFHIDSDGWLVSETKDRTIVKQPTPNKGGKMVPGYVVHHFTASSFGGGSKNVASWLCNPQAKASAHIVIPRDPTQPIMQLAPFDVVTWHAGKSEWKGLIGLNSHSVGIEIENPGALVILGGGRYKTAYGQTLVDNQGGCDIIEAPAPHTGVKAGWLCYSESQIEDVLEITQLLMERFPIKEILGHSDIAPVRKLDPGPAWPMDMIRSKLAGRDHHGGDDTAKTTVGLNLRAEPSPTGRLLVTMPANSQVTLTGQTRDGWTQVRFKYPGSTDELYEGWAATRYLADD